MCSLCGSMPVTWQPVALLGLQIPYAHQLPELNFAAILGSSIAGTSPRSHESQSVMQPPKYPSAKNIGLTRVCGASGKYYYRPDDENTEGDVENIIAIGVAMGVRCLPSPPNMAQSSPT